MNEIKILRKRVAALALELYSGNLSYQQFLDSIRVNDIDDEEDGGAEELIDMITHEPQVGGFLGVSQAEGKRNRDEILALIAKLQAD